MIPFIALGVSYPEAGWRCESAAMTEDEKHTLLRRYADYFRKAEEAYAASELTHDEVARNSLHMVALGWRRLATQIRRTLRRG